MGFERCFPLKGHITLFFWTPEKVLNRKWFSWLPHRVWLRLRFSHSHFAQFIPPSVSLFHVQFSRDHMFISQFPSPHHFQRQQPWWLQPQIGIPPWPSGCTLLFPSLRHRHLGEKLTVGGEKWEKDHMMLRCTYVGHNNDTTLRNGLKSNSHTDWSCDPRRSSTGSIQALLPSKSKPVLSFWSFRIKCIVYSSGFQPACLN